MDSELRKAVTNIHFGNPELKLKACGVIARAAAQEGVEMRRCLIGLGVVPQIITMISTSTPHSYHLSSLQALTQLCIGNSSGKRAILEAGGLEKLSKLYHHQNSNNREIQEMVAMLLFELSTLNLNKPIIGSSPALTLLVSILSSSPTVSESAKQASISALLNLATCLENINNLTNVSNSIVDSLFGVIQECDQKIRYKCLCILTNLLIIEQGRKSLEKSVEMNPGVLVGILVREEPKCQEMASYIIMVLAHYSREVRKVLRSSASSVQVLVEMGLVGTSGLLRKRCLRIIRSLKDGNLLS